MSLIAFRLKQLRLAANLSQEGLAERAGISHGSLKRFERTGQIALESLLKLASALRVLGDFELLFQESINSSYASLDEIIKEPKARKRGRGK